MISKRRLFRSGFDDVPAYVRNCVGIVRVDSSHDMNALSALRYRDMILNAVCCDDPWQAGCVLASGLKRMYIAIMYSVFLEEMFRIGRGSSVCIDMPEPYAGMLVPCGHKAVERALDRAMHGDVGPCWLCETDKARILSEAGNICWLCGELHSEGLCVQEMLPYLRPKFVLENGKFVLSVTPGDPGLCRALCSNCASAWRLYYDIYVRRCDDRWARESGFSELGRIVQGGFIESDDDIRLKKLRLIAMECVSEYWRNYPAQP